MRPLLYFIPVLLINLISLVSCRQQQVVNHFETGTVMNIKSGTVVKVTKFTISRDTAGQGTFAGMASSAATAITPGFMASGSSNIASSAGSLMDSKIETVAKVRIRIKMDNGELVEVIQNDIPGLNFKKGDQIILTAGGKDGNVWPD